MQTQAESTVRHASLLLLQRAPYVLGGVAFGVLVPRLLGPESYGAFSLLTSLSFGFSAATALGVVQVVGRFAPRFLVQDDRAGLARFFAQILGFRILTGVVGAAAYLLLTLLWLREVDPLALAAIAGVVALRAAGEVVFAVFLGLGQAARWGLSDLLHRYLGLGGVVLGFALGGLTGACLGLLAAEVVVLAIGLGWAGGQIAWRELRPRWTALQPYMSFGLSFFASGLAMTLFQRSGEAIVRLVDGDYVQVGYFGLAHSVALVGLTTTAQLAVSFAPFIATLREQGGEQAIQRWADRLLRVGAAGAVLAWYGAVLLGEHIVPAVFGRDYAVVAVLLVPLTLALVPQVLGSLARLLALAYERPDVALRAALLRLALFWTLGPPLVLWAGALGAALAVPLASAVYAVYYTRRMQRVIDFPLRGLWRVLGLGSLFLPVALLRGGLALDLALYLALAALFALAGLRLGVVRRDELTAVGRAVITWGRRSRET